MKTLNKIIDYVIAIGCMLFGYLLVFKEAADCDAHIVYRMMMYIFGCLLVIICAARLYGLISKYIINNFKL